VRKGRGLILVREGLASAKLTSTEQKSALDRFLLVESSASRDELVLLRPDFQDLIAHHGALMPNMIRGQRTAPGKASKSQQKEIDLMHPELSKG